VSTTTQQPQRRLLTSLADTIRSFVSGSRLLRLNAAAMPTAAALLIFVVLVTFGQVQYGGIVELGTIASLFINNAYLIILAVGMTFVILTGGIDLSVGSVVALSSVAGVMLANAGVNPWIAVLVMIAIGTVMGLLAGVLVDRFDVQPFIATLATMFLARGLASMLSTTPERLEADSAILGIATRLTIYDGPGVNDLVVPPSVMIAILTVVVAYVVLHRTRTGRTAYALGASEQSARLMGLPVARTRVLVYVISGSLAGLAAVTYTARLGSAQNVTGIGWELNAIAAVVIGGTLLTGGAGYVLGSLIGALVIALMNLLIIRDGSIPPESTTIITGGMLLVFVLLQRLVIARRRKG